ncbi:MAG: trigger factor [Coriobacteriia bacterium]|nr:trigger factor [Coriobacteriia bacterium]
MSFQSKVVRDGDGTAKVTVTVTAQQVDKAIAAEFRSLARQLRFPGFRPGKAPRSVIEGQVGRDYVLGQALEAVVNDSFPLAADAEALRTFGKAEFDDPPELVEGEDYCYTVKVVLRPELTLTSEEVSITMVSKDATEAEIDQQIEGTLERFAQYPAIEDAKATVAEDSFVTFSFESTIDGADYEGSTVEKHLYQLGQNMMPEAFDQGLVGAKAGQQLKIEFPVEDAGTNAEFAGKTMSFDLTIDALNEKKVPEVDDNFATMTGFETIDDMRKEIKSYIESQKAQNWERVRDDRLLQALAERLDGEPLPEMVEARADGMIDEFSRMLEQSNMTLEGYLEQANIDPEQYQTDMEEQASISVCNDLALEALARLKNIEADDATLDEEFEKAAAAELSEDKQSKVTAKTLRERWEKSGMMTRLRDDLSRKKALEWLRDNAEITIEEEEKDS